MEETQHEQTLDRNRLALRRARRKARAPSPPPDSTPSRFSRTICCRSTAARATSESSAATSSSRSARFSRSAISRACRSRSAPRNFARAERKFDLMQELGTDLLLICSNVSPASLGGIDRAADDFRELGERAAKRGLARRLRGAGLGTPCQRLPRRLGDRAARRSPRDRNHPRQLSRAGPPAFRSARWPRSPATRSSWSSLRTRRSSSSTSCPGAGTSAPSPARAICRSASSWRRSRRPAMPGRCRWRSSTTNSAPARPCRPRSTACVR